MKQKNVGDLFDPSFAEMSPEIIVQHLEAASYEVKEGSYTRQLSKNEIQEAEKNYAILGIEIAAKVEELAKINNEKKSVIKQTQMLAAEELEKIKSRSVFDRGSLFSVINEELQEMEIYDAYGVCVEVRPLRREERQRKMFNLNRVVNE